MGIDFKLGDFLDRGKIIRTRHCESHNWVTNMVYGIDEESIEVDMGLEKNYIDNILMIGDTMKCKFTTDEHEYIIIGWVTRINTQFPQSITIKVHQIERFENKRDRYRYDVYLSTVVKLKKEDIKGAFAILTNISFAGSAFIVREELGTLLGFDEAAVSNSNVYMEVYLSPQKIISVEGEIVRRNVKDRGIEYGVRHFDMELDCEKLLNDFMGELAIKDKEFYNKRSGFWSKNSKFGS